MVKRIVGVMGLVCLLVVFGTANSKIYDNLILSADFQSGNFGDIWDLTKCDAVLSYTLDLSGIAAPGWTVVEMGLREIGAPNLDPNLKGGFLVSRYNQAGSNDNLADPNDFHILMKHGWLFDKYDYYQDQIISPSFYGVNHAFWFDRDGVDEWQEDMWAYKDGATYNTGGVYEVIITFHALDDVTGTMYVTINGEQQGFYSYGFQDSPPDMMPVGRTFTGDMKCMQVFYGRGSFGGTVFINDISVIGCQKTIMVGDCSTGVTDFIYLGSTVSQAIADCAAAARNHGQFVKCVADLTNELKKDNLITGKEKGAIQRCAAKYRF